MLRDFSGKRKKLILEVLAVFLAVGTFNVAKHYYYAEESAPEVVTEGLVLDEAGLLHPSQQQWIAQYHAAIRDAYDIDLRVATVKGAPDLNAYTARRFEQLQVGNQSRTGRGLLLVIDPAKNEARLEVGRNLEGVYTDAFVKYIQEKQMVPFFQASQVANGILATTELIAGRAGEAKQGMEFDIASVKKFEPSTGAGAKSKAQIGAGYDAEKGQKDTRAVQLSGSDPQSVLDAYIITLRDGMERRDPAIYSKGSIAFFKGRVSTDAQARREFDSLSKCPQRQSFIHGGHAVVRHAIGQRQCNPYFFVQESGVWKLHFPDMAKYIRFNHKNEWHFNNGVPSSYAFAFKDWQFDGHYFPVANANAVSGTTPVYSPCKRYNAIYQLMPDGYSWVVWVAPQGAAHAMGIRYRDRVLYWGTDRPNPNDIMGYNSSVKPGETMSIRVERNGKELELSPKAPPYPLDNCEAQ